MKFLEVGLGSMMFVERNFQRSQISTSESNTRIVNLNDLVSVTKYPKPGVEKDIERLEVCLRGCEPIYFTYSTKELLGKEYQRIREALFRASIWVG